MVRLFVSLVVLSLVIPAAANPNPGRDAQQELEAGRLAYERGDYAIAVATLRPLLYPSIQLGSEEAVVEAHRLLALSYFFLKKEVEAEEEVAALLTLRPNYEFDPIVDPPPAVRFFEGVRQRQEERLRAIRHRQEEQAERAQKELDRRQREAYAKAERVYVDRRIVVHSRLVATLPFGAGQFQNGQVGKGVFFCVAEALLGSLSIAMWVTIDQRFPTRRFAPSEATLAETLIGLELASGAAFWALVGGGILDAHLHFVPQVVTTKELPRRKAISLVPLISGSQVGIGLQGVF